jgi:hypothetical protein
MNNRPLSNEKEVVNFVGVGKERGLAKSGDPCNIDK